MRITRTTLYERLRKRSYRKWIRYRISDREHEAYLQGVRDALRESGAA